MKAISAHQKIEEIEREFKKMTEDQMNKALSELCELVKKEMIEKVESAIYWMNNKRY